MDRHRFLIEHAARAEAMGRRGSYARRVMNIVGRGNIVGYWPLSETSGTAAKDIVNGLNGVYTNITLADAAGPCGHLVPYSKEAGDVMLANPAGLAATWAAKGAGAAGGVGGWLKWKTASAASNFAVMYLNAANVVTFGGNADGSLGIWATRGGVSHSSGATLKTAGWLHVFMTWSQAEDRLRYYLNGMLLETDTVIGTWAGNLPNFYLLGTAVGVLDGWMSDWLIVGGVEPTLANVRAMIAASPVYRPYHLAVLGDSISVTSGWNDWVWQVVTGLNDRIPRRTNHAVTGKGVMDGMDAQAAAAASDNADGIIIALGTNDDNAGNMSALQAEAEENIAELKANNPSARIYWLNVLPRWTNNTIGPEVDKSNVRAAISAACAAQGVTCWDTYTVPWITQAQTTDGVNLATAGIAAVAAEVLTRL